MNIQGPTLALVVAAYNAEPTISATLASVAAQTVPPDEVIVVNDGSNDRTLDKVGAWLHMLPLEIITYQGNRGPAHARNLGVKAATSTRISFLDADDMLMPFHVAVHKQSNLRDTDILASRGYFWNPDFDGLKKWKMRIPAETRQKHRILKSNFVPVWSSFSREQFLRLGGQRNDVMEDHDFWIRALHQGCTVVANPSRTYLYRTAEGSRSRSPGSLELSRAAILGSSTLTLSRRERRSLDHGLRILDGYKYLEESRQDFPGGKFQHQVRLIWRAFLKGDARVKALVARDMLRRMVV